MLALSAAAETRDGARLESATRAMVLASRAAPSAAKFAKIRIEVGKAVMGTICKNTALRIAMAYQEIERGEGLLVDVRKCLDERKERWPDGETDIQDVFGQYRRSLQLGVPNGNNGHKICDLSYELAVPIIEAHIANKRAEVAALTVLARSEMEAASAVAAE